MELGVTASRCARRKTLGRRMARRRGAAFVEYLVLVGVIALACIFVFRQFGSVVKSKLKEQAVQVQRVGD